MNLVTLRGLISVRAWLVLALLGFSLIPLTTFALNLEPYSLRVPWYIEGDGAPYWEVRVTCSDKITRRFLVQYQQFGPWCLKKAPDTCFDEKVPAAFEACSSRFDELIAEQEKSEAAAQGQMAEKDRLKERILRQQAALQQQRRNLNNRKLQLDRIERELQDRKRSILERRSKLQ